MTAGPPASWTSRSVPAVSGIALRATSATGTGQLRSRVLIGPPASRDRCDVAGASTVADGGALVRQRETPSPIIAMPFGTANGR